MDLIDCRSCLEGQSVILRLLVGIVGRIGLLRCLLRIDGLRRCLWLSVLARLGRYPCLRLLDLVPTDRGEIVGVALTVGVAPALQGEADDYPLAYLKAVEQGHLVARELELDEVLDRFACL